MKRGTKHQKVKFPRRKGSPTTSTEHYLRGDQEVSEDDILYVREFISQYLPSSTTSSAPSSYLPQFVPRLALRAVFERGHADDHKFPKPPTSTEDPKKKPHDSRSAIIEEFTELWGIGFPIVQKIASNTSSSNGCWPSRSAFEEWLKLIEIPSTTSNKTTTIIHEAIEHAKGVCSEICQGIIGEYHRAFWPMAMPYCDGLIHLCRMIACVLPLLSFDDISGLYNCLGSCDPGELCMRASEQIFEAWDVLQECPWVAMDIIRLVSLDNYSNAGEMVEEIARKWIPEDVDVSANSIIEMLVQAASFTKKSLDQLADEIFPKIWSARGHPPPPTLLTMFRVSLSIGFAVQLASDDYGLITVHEEDHEDEENIEDDDNNYDYAHRSFINGEAVFSLSSLGAACADPIVRTAFEMEVVDCSLDGTYLTGWIEKLDLYPRIDRMKALEKSPEGATVLMPTWLKNSDEVLRRAEKKAQSHLKEFLKEHEFNNARDANEYQCEMLFLLLMNHWIFNEIEDCEERTPLLDEIQRLLNETQKNLQKSMLIKVHGTSSISTNSNSNLIPSPSTTTTTTTTSKPTSKTKKIKEKHKELKERSCKKCGKVGIGMKMCGNCRQVHYCSIECQKADWPNHKSQCHKK